MPTYVITAPDGKEYEVDAPEGASQDAALKYFQSNWKPEQKAEQKTTNNNKYAISHPVDDLAKKYIFNPLNEVAGTVVEPALQMGTGYLGSAAGNLAAVGAMGANALTGEYKDPEQIKQSVQNAMTYEPKTAGGQFVSQNMLAPIGGAIESGVGAIAKPLSMGNQYAEAGLKEAGLQGIGLLGIKGGKGTATALESGNAAKLAALNVERQANRIKDATRLKGKELDLYAPAESGVKETLSGLGKANPYISRKNVITTTNVLADEVGLPKGAISDIDMAARIKKLGEDYTNVSNALPKQVTIPSTFKQKTQAMINELDRQYTQNPAVFEDNLPVIKNLQEQLAVNQLSPDILMQTVRRLRENSRNIEKRATKTIAEENLAKTNYDVANMYEDIIEQSLSNKKALLDKFRDSRMKLSKLHIIDSARMSNGLIDPQKLGTAVGKYGSNKKFVSGNLKTVVDFANQFKDVMRYVEESALPKVTGWELAGGAAGVAGSTVNPASLAFAIPATAKAIVPSLAERGMMQTMPNYSLSAARRALPTALSGAITEGAFSPYIKEQQ